MTTREDFEKWYLQEYGIDISEHFIGDRYLYEKMQMQYMGYQACAAHYEAELLKRDALIAEKDKALKAAQVSIGRLTSDEGSIQEDFDNEDTIQHALSLTHDSVRLKQLGSVKEHGGSIAVFNCIEPISVGTKLYTIVKGAAE